jgi:hypothetical protein
VEAVDQQGDAGWYTSLALDPAGWPHVAYQAHAAGEARHAWLGPHGWQVEVVDPGPQAGGFASLALLGDEVYLAHHDLGSQRLELARRDGAGAWSNHVVDGGDAGAYASLVADGECGLVLAWVHPTQGVKAAEYEAK